MSTVFLMDFCLLITSVKNRGIYRVLRFNCQHSRLSFDTKASVKWVAFNGALALKRYKQLIVLRSGANATTFNIIKTSNNKKRKDILDKNGTNATTF